MGFCPMKIVLGTRLWTGGFPSAVVFSATLCSLPFWYVASKLTDRRISTFLKSVFGRIVNAPLQSTQRVEGVTVDDLAKALGVF